jgi:catechol 2,3-dioxygenase-like lactoylglutathione lyase family enzyme
MTISGISHITLVVREIDRAVDFYVTLLGARLRARWARGAYLDVGGVWLCLELGNAAPTADDSHVAFAVNSAVFAIASENIRNSGVPIWKENRSEGASIYFEDLDNHKLELHVGDLDSRLEGCRKKPYDGMRFFDDDDVVKDA